MKMYIKKLENMEITKIKSYLGFAIRSNQVIYGLDNILVCKKKIHLILVSNSISDNSLEKVKALSIKKNYDYILLPVSLEELTKRQNLKVLAITNFELAKAIKNS